MSHQTCNSPIAQTQIIQCTLEVSDEDENVKSGSNVVGMDNDHSHDKSTTAADGNNSSMEEVSDASGAGRAHLSVDTSRSSNWPHDSSIQDESIQIVTRDNGNELSTAETRDMASQNRTVDSSSSSANSCTPTVETITSSEGVRVQLSPHSPRSFSGSDSDEEEESSQDAKKKIRKLKPNLRSSQVVIAKRLRENSFLKVPVDSLPEIPRPEPPQLSGKLTSSKLQQIQQFISSFEYNFLPEFFFNVNKHRPLYQVMETCNEIIREALPIRCVEGTFLAIWATQKFAGENTRVYRYPVSFRSCVHDTSFKHIVLIVQKGNKFGALGMSRKSTLCYKPLKYSSLSSILQNFKRCYEKIGHTLLGFTVGLPISHNPFSKDTIPWEFLQFHLHKHKWSEHVAPILNQFSNEAQKLNDEFRVACKLSARTKRTYKGYLVSKYKKQLSKQLEKDAAMSRGMSSNAEDSKADSKQGNSSSKPKNRPKSAKKSRKRSAVSTNSKSTEESEPAAGKDTISDGVDVSGEDAVEKESSEAGEESKDLML